MASPWRTGRRLRPPTTVAVVPLASPDAKDDAASSPRALFVRVGGYNDSMAAGEDFAAIEVPVYAVSGWADNYSEAVPRLLAGLSGPRRGLIGPWGPVVLGAPLALGGLLSISWGVKFAHALPERVLRGLFAGFLLLCAVLLGFKV